MGYSAAAGASTIAPAEHVDCSEDGSQSTASEILRALLPVAVLAELPCRGLDIHLGLHHAVLDLPEYRLAVLESEP
jgi:hypothetical protein